MLAQSRAVGLSDPLGQGYQFLGLPGQSLVDDEGTATVLGRGIPGE